MTECTCETRACEWCCWMRGAFISYICLGSNLSILLMAAFREWWVKEMTPAMYPAVGALIHSQDLAITPALLWQKMEHQACGTAGCGNGLSLTTKLLSAGLLQPPPAPLQSFSFAVRNGDKSNLAYWWLYSGQQVHIFLPRDRTMGTPNCPHGSPWCLPLWGSSDSAGLWLSSCALHHLADHQMLSFGLGTAFWIWDAGMGPRCKGNFFFLFS